MCRCTTATSSGPILRLDQRDGARFQPVLRHGDFGPSNILFDATTRTISGIVDFGSAALGDPAAWSTIGRVRHERTTARYPFAHGGDS
jgi:hypothetical protein